jgi:hypothetical protein
VGRNSQLAKSPSMNMKKRRKKDEKKLSTVKSTTQKPLRKSAVLAET